MMRYFLLLAAILTGLSVVHASDSGSFSNPAATSRPFFRYWLPDASVDPELVASDIASAGAVGAGGVEFLPFYNYGGEVGKYPAGADWAKYGFGTAAFRSIFRRSLEAHKDNGMVMDFAIGPNQGQGVPAASNDEGLQWDLVPFAEQISPNTGKAAIQLPGWGEGELIAAVTANVISKTNVTTEPSYLELIVQEDALQVVTSKVSDTGALKVSDTQASSKRERWVFAFYQRRTMARNVLFPAKSSDTIFDNGSFTVDHFSARGAQTVIDFWETHILPDGVDKLISQVGNYAWEDSLEIQSNITWTPRLPQRFNSLQGYEIYPYLPLIMWGNNNLNTQRQAPGKIRVVLDSKTKGSGYVNAYRATLQKCYQEYLGTLSEWSNRRLSCPISLQVSYNMPMDAPASVPFADIPECESLQWQDNIDGYLQFSGAASLAGKGVVSNEMGAKFLSAFKHAIPNLLGSINRAFAGGINRVVLHGQTYAHNYFETTWPGYAAWQYVVSETYSEKFPSWHKGFNEALNYAARTQHVLQSGRSLVDIAIYNKVSASDFNFGTFYESKELLGAGYSYAYLTPDNFELSTATIRGAQLGPNTARFKALVIPPEHNEITLEGAELLIKFAKNGLPIIFNGEPKYYAMGKGDTDAVSKLLHTLFKLPSVHRCAKADLASTLKGLAIAPRVVTQLNSTVHTVWRDDHQRGISYLFVYADRNASSGFMEVEAGDFPYIFNAWSGQITPLLQYSITKSRGVMRIPLDLAAGQSLILGFSEKPRKDVDSPDFSIEKMPAAVVGHEFSRRDGLSLHVRHTPFSSSNQDDKLVLSTGHSQRIVVSSSNLTQPFELKDWTLEVEHWEAPEDITDASVIAVKRNTTHRLRAPLLGWTKISSLANSSGIGYYHSQIEWSNDIDKYGAYLTLPPILHAVQLLINGHKTQPIDSSKPVVDIGPYLRQGRNSVILIAPSTMWNYIRSLGSQVMSSGAPPLHVYGAKGNPTILPIPEMSENGVVGNVILTPYERVRVQLP